MGITPARAEPPPQLNVASAGSCPAAGDVARELRRLFPTLEVTTAAASSDPADAVLQERPGGLEVAVRGSRRDFDDPGNRCAERAQLAAVFIAVVLDPPRFPLPAPEPPPPPPPPPAPPAGRPLLLTLAPIFQAAPGSEPRTAPLAFGGGARVIWGQAISLSAGLAVLGSTTLRYPQADARALWVPVDLGARLTHRAGAADLGGEASLVIAPVRLQGQNLDPGEARWRVEAGARMAVFAHLWVTSRVGLAAGVHGTFFPRPYTLQVDQVGPIGKTPQFWLGGSLGLVFRLH